ncbi:MAG: OmpA family protein [Spirochaetales bacterium]|nr:OmpA family protein [Spirochaetales bacterium]
MKSIGILLFILSSLSGYAETSPGEINPQKNIIISPELACSYSFPAGNAARTLFPGWGGELGLHAENIFTDKSAFLVNFGYDFIRETLPDIDSIVIVSLSLFAGYRIVDNPLFRITPSAGCGFLGHIVEQDGYSLYFDPHLAVQSEFTLPLVYHFSVSATPRLMLFFEGHDIGMMVKVCVGIKRDFFYRGEKKRPANTVRHVFISEDARVFSPDGDGFMDTISFSVDAGPDRLTGGYEFAIIDEYGRRVRKMEGVIGTAFAYESALTWNGYDDGGQRASDGGYRAVFTVQSDNGARASAESGIFLLDTSPPVVRLSIVPEIFSPDDDGINDTLSVSATISDLSGIADWTIIIERPGGTRVKTFTGRGPFPGSIEWDGIPDNGEKIESAALYPLYLTVRDEGGNHAVAAGMIETDILIEKREGGNSIVVSNIYFEPYSSDFASGSGEIIGKNRAVITRLAEILKRFSSCEIVIEGHSFNEFHRDKKRAEKAEREVFFPLSKKRADAVKKALVETGIDGSRITTRGKGSSEPLVPYDDEKNSGRNRRVEIYLEER